MASSGVLKQYEEFLHHISHVDTPTDLADLFESHTKRMGFEYYSYHVVRPEHGQRVAHFISNYPRHWGAHYGNEGFLVYDPVVTLSAQVSFPFLWSELGTFQQLSKKQKAMLSDIASIGITQGTTIPIHGPNRGLAMLTVGNDAKNNDFKSMWGEYRDVLQSATLRCHEMMSRFHPGNPGAAGIYSLSDRERECLTWAGRGKTVWETSRIIGLKEKTVENYIGNAMTKLGVNTKIHAVVKAIVAGLISPEIDGPLVEFGLDEPGK